MIIKTLDCSKSRIQTISFWIKKIKQLSFELETFYMTPSPNVCCTQHFCETRFMIGTVSVVIIFP